MALTAMCAARGAMWSAGTPSCLTAPWTRPRATECEQCWRQAGVECTLEARDATYGGGQMMERLASYQAQRPDAVNSELERWRQAFADGMLIRPLEEYKGEPIYKICYIAPGRDCLAQARAAYEDQFLFCEAGGPAQRQGFVSGELINRKFNKGEGIRRICDFCGLPTSAAWPLGTARTTWKWPMWPGSAAAWRTAPRPSRPAAPSPAPRWTRTASPWRSAGWA